VVPELIRRVGRLGVLIEAAMTDPFRNHGPARVVYDEGNVAGFIHDEIARLGPTAFADHFDIPRDRAKKLRSPNRQPSPATVRTVLAALPTAATSRTCALDDCDVPVGRADAKYCSKAHRDRGYRQRQRSLRHSTPELFADLTCAGCGTVLLGSAAHGPCPVCSTPTEAA
jgi:hypothetical protein